MKQYEKFIFDSVGFDDVARAIELRYSLDNEIDFVEKLILPANVPLRTLEEHDTQQAIMALHIIGGISYYKTCLPPKIDIAYGGLTKKEADFWTAVYENGLGEFFYKNKIDPAGVVNFSAEAETVPMPLPPHKTKTKVLVPIGGGKDSLVTIELLRKAGYDITLFRMGHHPYIEEMARVAGLPLITVNRHLSDALFKLNEEGALNGHIPITAYLCALSVIIAQLTDHTHVVLSNERSADEGNLSLDGRDVNHQWSKSLAFETMFNEYLRSVVTNDVTVFSLLRPLSELQIARELSNYPQYLPLFTSCNKNWKIRKPAPLRSSSSEGHTSQSRESGGLPRVALSETKSEVWCCECPKCAFGFVLFGAFLPKEKVLEIFGTNLFENEELLPLFKELLGIEGHKPFECVGTAKEVSAALLLMQKREGWEKTPVMEMFVKEALPKIKNPEDIIEESLTSHPLDSLPAEFRPALTKV